MQEKRDSKKDKVDIGHYVPRAYLKSFAYKGDTCYTYDRIQNKYYPSNIDNIMGERYFYDFPDEVIKAFQDGHAENIDKQILEKLLGQTVDSYWKHIVENIESNYKEWFTLKWSMHFVDVYRCATVQLLRTKKGKDMVAAIYKGFYKKEVEEDVKNVLLAKEIGDVLKETPDSFLMEYLLNTYGHICIGLNESEIPFITGDNPVLVLNKCKGEDIVYYPVTPKRCIFLKPRKKIESQLNNVMMEFVRGEFKGSVADLTNEAYNREKKLMREKNPPYIEVDREFAYTLNTSIYLVSNRWIISNMDLEENKDVLYLSNADKVMMKENEHNIEALPKEYNIDRNHMKI